MFYNNVTTNLKNKDSYIYFISIDDILSDYPEHQYYVIGKSETDVYDYYTRRKKEECKNYRTDGKLNRVKFFSDLNKQDHNYHNQHSHWK